MAENKVEQQAGLSKFAATDIFRDLYVAEQALENFPSTENVANYCRSLAIYTLANQLALNNPSDHLQNLTLYRDKIKADQRLMDTIALVADTTAQAWEMNKSSPDQARSKMDLAEGELATFGAVISPTARTMIMRQFRDIAGVSDGS